MAPGDFERLDPLPEGIEVGREILHQACADLDLDFDRQVMDDGDRRVVVGYWPEDSVPLLIGVYLDAEGELTFRAEARCLPIPRRRMTEFVRRAMELNHDGWSSLSAPGDGWIYAVECRPLDDVDEKEIALAAGRVTSTCLYAQKILGSEFRVRPSHVDDPEG